MLDLVILFGLFAAIAITIFSVGLADDSGTTYKPKKDEYFMQRKAEESATYFSNLGLQPAAAYEAKPEDKLNSDSSSKVKYVEDPFSGGSLGDLMVELGPPLPAGYGDVKVVKGSKGDTGPPGPPGGPGKDGTNGTNGISGENGIDGSNGIDGTNGIDGRNGGNGEDGGGGNGEDSFKKYFGRGSFIYAPNNSGVIGPTYGNVNNTDNNSTGAGDNYSQTGGHVFKDGKPSNTTSEKPGDYSITAGIIGHSKNVISGQETPTITEDGERIYGHNQEIDPNILKKENYESK